ncbi:N-acetylglucosamine-6-phosphate deacetylase [Arsenicitalea aurantiaca]|uniref:N-acetylglucosamine-6-phosphate deacetylase n=1 Tax=Arsenicitalea aurantiaca TaxID=1783274 RepID=A0A433XET3_9HYPH|nr:N-acetylglucosamine-6-phosphate deacetylase [Arsenicitalea aurantiaca]RUT32514.1 N-acetylglucosamine-6-phosphate deacetylase [Arsenicitalea aurantiaca]
MSTLLALTGATIFDGELMHHRSALLVRDGVVEGLAAADSPLAAERVAFDGGLIVPGFLDLQVNGGGGALFNADPTPRTIATLCDTFAKTGTTGLLPTLVTDTPETTALAIAAGIAVAEAGDPRFLGLHLEGPHLSVARKGAHDPALIRPMTDADEAALIAARRRLPALLVTLAPETVPPERIARLASAGVTVSLGHSDAPYALARAAAEAGAGLVTHLFNAMSQLGHREPGLVGAALDSPALHAGLIADGIHVHPAAIRTALAAKAAGPGRIFLVTDAMSPTGTDQRRFILNGREVHRADGALRLADGTLAGADLTMIDAVRFMVEGVGLDLPEALRMASLHPATALGIAPHRGHLQKGARADFIHLSDGLACRSTWVGGTRVWGE